MQAQPGQGPWWAALTIWGVVNVVCILQAVGFLSRVLTGSSQVNHLLGYVIVVLAIPTILALVAFVGAHAAWSQWIGPVAFLAFVALMMVVEYIGHIEFRSPPRYGILVPYLVLFFGSILFMGLPMFRLNRTLWFVTVASATFLLVSMVAALRRGVG